MAWREVRKRQAAASSTGIPTDHLLVAALAASLQVAAKLKEAIADSFLPIFIHFMLIALLFALMSFIKIIRTNALAPEVKLSLIVPMRDGPGHGQAQGPLHSSF